MRTINGFTLMDMAILLTIIGLMMTPILKQIEIEAMNNRSGNTRSNLDTIDQAISQYYFANDKYPCPADPNKSPADADYGEADPVFCTGAVSQGAVPFKTLKIPVASSLDGWKNKIIYAVTTALTTAPVNPAGGVLVVKGMQETGPGTYSLNDIASGGGGHFILISAGKTGIGAYSASGKLVEVCTNNTFESENCDGDDTFYLDYGNARSDVAGPNFYDDLTSFRNGGVSPRIWNFSPQDPTDITSNARFIGIGTDEPEVALDVAGDIQTTGGTASAGTLCMTSATDFDSCVSANAIAGTGIGGCASDGMEPMTGISKGGAECELTYKNLTTGQCPAGMYVRGLNPGGNIVCFAP